MITAAEIIACNPCRAWPHDRIRALVGDGIMPSELARLYIVPLAARRWALMRVLARRDPRTIVRWACDVAMDGVQQLAAEERDAAEACLSAALAWCEGGSIDDVREARIWLYSLGWGATAAHVYAAIAIADAVYAVYAVAVAYAGANAYDYAYAGGDDTAAAQDYLDALAAHGGAS